MQLTQHWRLNTQRYQLTGEQCEHCGASIFPPRDVCPACAEPAQELQAFSGRGTVYSYTTVLDAPAAGRQPAAIVRLRHLEITTG